MKNLAIIPARGGSKRLPRKNVLPIGGKPMISWTIEAALQSNLFQKVVVSSDDSEVLSICSDYDVAFDERPDGLETDHSTVDEVCLELVRRGEYIQKFDTICCLYPTSPLRRATDIHKVLGLVIEGVAEQAMSVTTFDLYAHQAMFLEDEGILKALRPDIYGLRPNKLPKVVCDNGSIYASTISALIQHSSLVGPNIRGAFMEKSRSVDVDTSDDLLMLEFRFNQLGI